MIVFVRRVVVCLQTVTSHWFSSLHVTFTIARPDDFKREDAYSAGQLCTIEIGTAYRAQEVLEA